MSEEEKHAIEFFNKVIYQIGEEDIMKNNCILLNLIDRLQKENEELDRKLFNANNSIREGIDRYCYLEKHSISKDIIRNKIKELEENSSTVSVFEIDILKELLGE